MPTIIIPGRSAYRRPNYPFGLNRESMHADQLVGWWPMAGDIKDYSAIGSANQQTATGAFKWASGLFVDGLVFVSSVSTDLFQKSSGVVGFGNVRGEPFTWSVWMCAGGGTASGSFADGSFCRMSGAGGSGMSIDKASSTINFTRSSDGAVIARGTFNPNGVNPQPFQTVVTYDGTTSRVYRNGFEEGNGTGAIDNVAITAIRPIGGLGANCQAWDSRFWKRCFSAREVWALYDPQTRWDLYWVPSTRVYIFPNRPLRPATSVNFRPNKIDQNNIRPRAFAPGLAR